MIIAVEGIDGAGKQTLVQALTTRLLESGSPLNTVAFPRYSEAPFGTSIGEALSADSSVLRSSVEAMAVMYAADRWHWWSEHGEESAVWLADRWCASNAAYGSARLLLAGHESSAFIDWVESLEFGELGLPRPDLTILLATGERLASTARKNRSAEDAYEATLGLQDHALDTYLGLAKSQWGGSWLILDPISSADERKPASQLAEEVLDASSMQSLLR